MIRPATLALCFTLAAASLGSAWAAEGLRLDYGDAGFRESDAPISGRATDRILKAMPSAPAAVRTALKSGFAVLGEAKGPITGGKGEDTVYLLSPKRPVAAQPTGDQRQVLAVIGADNKLAGAYLLPETGYARLVGLVPTATGMGRDVVLDGSFMNMGQTVTALDVVHLGPGEAASVRQTLKDVYVDACDNPAGEKIRKAAVVTADAAGTLNGAWQDLGCGK